MSAQMGAILRDLGRIRDAMDLTKGLGARLLEHTAKAILEQMDKQLDPDGDRWDELSEAYARRKAKINPGAPMAVLYERMKTLDNLMGVQDVTPTTAAMTYGYATDDSRIEAYWFQEGDEEQNRPPRPFYALSAEAIRRCDAEIRATLRRA